MKEYLKNRWDEKSTRVGLALAVVAAATAFFPEYASIINNVAGALGLGMACAPTGGGK